MGVNKALGSLLHSNCLCSRGKFWPGPITGPVLGQGHPEHMLTRTICCKDPGLAFCSCEKHRKHVLHLLLLLLDNPQVPQMCRWPLQLPDICGQSLYNPSPQMAPRHLQRSLHPPDIQTVPIYPSCPDSS